MAPCAACGHDRANCNETKETLTNAAINAAKTRRVKLEMDSDVILFYVVTGAIVGAACVAAGMRLAAHLAAL